jgi:hypothetical protein
METPTHDENGVLILDDDLATPYDEEIARVMYDALKPVHARAQRAHRRATETVEIQHFDA